jgi:hypothetical protein
VARTGETHGGFLTRSCIITLCEVFSVDVLMYTFDPGDYTSLDGCIRRRLLMYDPQSHDTTGPMQQNQELLVLVSASLTNHLDAMVDPNNRLFSITCTEIDHCVILYPKDYNNHALLPSADDLAHVLGNLVLYPPRDYTSAAPPGISQSSVMITIDGGQTAMVGMPRGIECSSSVPMTNALGSAPPSVGTASGYDKSLFPGYHTTRSTDAVGRGPWQAGPQAFLLSAELLM